MKNPKLLTCVVILVGFSLGYSAVQVGYGFSVGMFALVSCGAVRLSEDRRHQTARLVREAMEKTGYSLTTAARTCEMDIAEFSRMLTGQRSLDLWRLEMLGEDFMATFALLQLQTKGLPAFARTAIKILPLLGRERA